MAPRKNAHPKKVDINMFIVLYKSVNEKRCAVVEFSFFSLVCTRAR
nr:MAG TPA: hypothetical protein [Caudoviricetes sp.]